MHDSWQKFFPPFLFSNKYFLLLKETQHSALLYSSFTNLWYIIITMVGNIYTVQMRWKTFVKYMLLACLRTCFKPYLMTKRKHQEKPKNISTLHRSVSVPMKNAVQPKSVGQTDIWKINSNNKYLNWTLVTFMAATLLSTKNLIGWIRTHACSPKPWQRGEKNVKHKFYFMYNSLITSWQEMYHNAGTQ